MRSLLRPHLLFLLVLIAPLQASTTWVQGLIVEVGKGFANFTIMLTEVVELSTPRALGTTMTFRINPQMTFALDGRLVTAQEALRLGRMIYIFDKGGGFVACESGSDGQIGLIGSVQGDRMQLVAHPHIGPAQEVALSADTVFKRDGEIVNRDRALQPGHEALVMPKRPWVLNVGTGLPYQHQGEHAQTFAGRLTAVTPESYTVAGIRQGTEATFTISEFGNMALGAKPTPAIDALQVGRRIVGWCYRSRDYPTATQVVEPTPDTILATIARIEATAVILTSDTGEMQVPTDGPLLIEVDGQTGGLDALKPGQRVTALRPRPQTIAITTAPFAELTPADLLTRVSKATGPEAITLAQAVGRRRSQLDSEQLVAAARALGALVQNANKDVAQQGAMELYLIGQLELPDAARTAVIEESIRAFYGKAPEPKVGPFSMLTLQYHVAHLAPFKSSLSALSIPDRNRAKTLAEIIAKLP